MRYAARVNLDRTRERLEMRLRSLVGRHAFQVDSLGHRLPLPKRLSHNLCLAADVTVGWGPDASDWPEAKTPFLRWFYQWFWNGNCPTCGGQGEIQIWRQGDPTDDFHPETCPGCAGTGLMSPTLAEAI